MDSLQSSIYKLFHKLSPKVSGSHPEEVTNSWHFSRVLQETYRITNLGKIWFFYTKKLRCNFETWHGSFLVHSLKPPPQGFKFLTFKTKRLELRQVPCLPQTSCMPLFLHHPPLHMFDFMVFRKYYCYWNKENLSNETSCLPVSYSGNCLDTRF